MQLTKEQFDTLKDFDLETFEMFKNRTDIVNKWGDSASYVPANESVFVVQTGTNSEYNFTVLEKDKLKHYNLKMLPLFFVEDKPVYPGDVLYYRGGMQGAWIVTIDEYREGDEKYLTWNKPKVKKEAWVNLYRYPNSDAKEGVRSAYSTEDKAKMSAEGCEGYIKTIRIEWEE